MPSFFCVRVTIAVDMDRDKLTQCKNNSKKLHSMSLASLLNQHTSSYPEEDVYRAMMIAFLSHHEDAFERSCPLGHFTGSAWIVNQQRTKVLMMHHAKLNKWLQLGGHCDGQQEILEVALKEAKEESGLSTITPLSDHIYDMDIHLIPARPNENSHYHYDVRFLMSADSDQPLVMNHEAKALTWVPLERVHEKSQERSILRMVEKTIGAKTKVVPHHSQMTETTLP